MANEPERPIERLLRAAAKKRRDDAGAPLELHPANRRLLQGEVTRQFGRAQPEGRPVFPLLVRLWPRFAWGVAILAVLGVAVWMLVLVPDKSEQAALMARNEPMQKALGVRESLPPAPTTPAEVPPHPVAVAPANPAARAYADTAQPASRKLVPQSVAGAPLAAKDSFAVDTDGSVRENLALAPTLKQADRRQAAGVQVAAPDSSPGAPPYGYASGTLGVRYGLTASSAPPVRAPAAPAPPPLVAGAPAAASLMAADESERLTLKESAPSGQAYKSLATVASANRPGPSAAPVDSLAKSAASVLKKAKSPSVAQRFTQVAPGSWTEAGLADKAKSAQPVLSSFQVEQAGSDLRVVDGDGSVYTGYVQVDDAVRRTRAVKAEAPAAARASKAVGGALEQGVPASFDSDQSTPQNYSFRVAGTNRSLNKQVVFTGNFIAATNLIPLPPVASNPAPGDRLGGTRTGFPQPGALPLIHSRIAGKVVIGSAKPVELHALPTAP